ncbi:histidine kinase [Nonomuraea sp. NPDC004186]
MALARDVHDVVAHTLAVLGVQFTVAEDAFDHDPDMVREAVLTAQRVRGQAMTKLRALIGALRDDGEGAGGELSALVERLRPAGLEVAVRQEGAPVPAPLAWMAWSRKR